MNESCPTFIHSFTTLIHKKLGHFFSDLTFIFLSYNIRSLHVNFVPKKNNNIRSLHVNFVPKKNNNIRSLHVNFVQ